jgi:hypothetical protein
LKEKNAMKKLLFTLITAICFSCEDGCEERREELTSMENHLIILHEQKDIVYKSLIEIDGNSDPETIIAMQAVEDELMMIAIEIAITEINLEQFKEEYSRCL